MYVASTETSCPDPSISDTSLFLTLHSARMLVPRRRARTERPRPADERPRLCFRPEDRVRGADHRAGFAHNGAAAHVWALV